METRNVKISLETATRWYNGTDNELKQLAIQTYPELEKTKLPKNWYDLRKITGYYTNDSSIIEKVENVYTTDENKNVFATENQAISHGRAAAQLSQLMAVYNDGWTADWSDDSQVKSCIKCFDGELSVDNEYSYKYFLTFKTPELTEEFLENFKELINTYYNF